MYCLKCFNFVVNFSKNVAKKVCKLAAIVIVL